MEMGNPKREGQGYRKTGDHQPTTSPSPRGSALTPSQSSTSSETTGSASPERGVENSIGAEPTGTAVAIRQHALAECLTGNNPEATDKALLMCLPPSVERSIGSKERTVIDSVYGFDTVFESYYFAEPPSREDAAAALVIAERACVPAPQRAIVAELARLRLLVTVRAEQEKSLEALAIAFAEEMAEYPPDIVRGVIREWGRREKWWPSWAELKERLDRAFKKRRALRDSLRKVVR